jgi:hypothetical protein
MNLSELSPTSQRIFLYLLYIEDHANHRFYYKQITLANRLGVSRRTVSRAFTTFLEKQLISIWKKHKRHTEYIILWFPPKDDKGDLLK